MKINITYVPYHDWRKILQEGNRTRDAHFIEAYRKANQGKLLIINRPTTRTELLVKKKKISSKLPYKIVIKEQGKTLYKLDQNTYLIDLIVLDDLNQILKKRKWFFDCYENSKLLDFYTRSLEELGFDNEYIISANVFSYKFIAKLNSSNILFDAWDNFCLMPAMQGIKQNLTNAYSNLSSKVNKWVTNSEENINYYKKEYQVQNIELIKNGVGLNTFSNDLELPNDLKEIKALGNKIAGFGGKITHLFDADLFNYLTASLPDINFVIVGQILDKNVFASITKLKNVFYLGDKHYKDYPSYVSNFDIGIVPYKIGDMQHGGDSIKVYEYLASNLKVIGTNGNGLEFLNNYIDVVNTKDEFVHFIKHSSTNKQMFDVGQFSWETKAKRIINILEEKRG